MIYENIQMKVLLVTIAIGDTYLKQYKQFFQKSQEAYAKKCGYDFKVITDFLDKTSKHPSTISFNKILVCSQEWSSQYDFIIFIDADIVINSKSPPIHTHTIYGHCIGIVNEFSQPSMEKRFMIHKREGWEANPSEYYKLSGFELETNILLNTGVLVLQPKLHREILENIYNTYIQTCISHPRGFHFEQSCIGYELQKQNLYKIIDNKFNAIWLLTKLDTTEKTTLQTYVNHNYFTHFAGHTDIDKLYYITV